MHNISKNFWYSIFNMVITMIVNLVAIRVLLSSLGNVKFGIFAIITILNSLSSLFSFGLNYTLLHYIPKQGKGNESNLDIIVVLLISLVISLVLFVAVFVSAPYIFQLIKAPVYLESETVKFIRYISLTLLFLLPIQILLTVFDCLQKNYISNILQVIFSLFYWGLLGAITFYSNDLTSLGLGLSVFYPVWFILLWIVFKKIWGGITVMNFQGNFQRVFRKHISSGTKYFVTNIVGYLNEPISKILISRFIGLETVAFFDIAMRVKNQVWGLFNKLTYPFIPFFSATNDKKAVRKFIISLTAVILVFASIFSLYFVWAGESLIYLWLKSDSEVLVNFVVISVGGYLLFSAIVFPVYYYFVSENKSNYLTLIQLAGSVVNIVAFFLLKNLMGAYSIIISHIFSLFVSMLLSFYLYSYYEGAVNREELKVLGGSIRYIIPFVLLTLLVLVLQNIAQFANPGFVLLIFSCFFGLLLLFVIKSSSFINRYPIIKSIVGDRFFK